MAREIQLVLWHPVDDDESYESLKEAMHDSCNDAHARLISFEIYEREGDVYLHVHLSNKEWDRFFGVKHD